MLQAWLRRRGPTPPPPRVLTLIESFDVAEGAPGAHYLLNAAQLRLLLDSAPQLVVLALHGSVRSDDSDETVARCVGVTPYVAAHYDQESREKGVERVRSEGLRLFDALG